jgi:hypothetical protein
MGAAAFGAIFTCYWNKPLGATRLSANMDALISQSKLLSSWRRLNMCAIIFTMAAPGMDERRCKHVYFAKRKYSKHNTFW